MLAMYHLVKNVNSEVCCVMWSVTTKQGCVNLTGEKRVPDREWLPSRNVEDGDVSIQDSAMPTPENLP